MSLFDNMPCVLTSGVFAFIGMENDGEVFELLFDLFFGSRVIELEDIVRIVEFLIEESFDFDVGFESFGFDGFELEVVDFFGILLDFFVEGFVVFHYGC